jgi:Cadherin-like beta sandwich domain
MLASLVACLAIAAVLVVAFGGSSARADGTQANDSTSSTDFEGFTAGDVNGQFGWTSGHGSSFCPLYDVDVVPNTFGYPSFGTQSLRISNAIACTSYNDQTFSPSLPNEAGETSATTSTYSGGTRQPYFEAQWDFASTVPGAEQPDLSVVASPDRGDPSRMSWVQMEDTPTGLQVNFEEYKHSLQNFVTTPIATGLDRTVPHTVKITMQFVDGPSNDIVNVYVDGALAYTGTSWEDYYRDSAAGGEPAPVDSIMFRMAVAAPATVGHGFLIDNFSEYSGPVPDADLTSLSLSSGALSPAFSPSLTSYTTAVDNSTASITASTGVASGSSVVVSGNSNLAVGANTITVTVTAADGTTVKTYTIIVTRAAPAATVTQTTTTTTPDAGDSPPSILPPAAALVPDAAVSAPASAPATPGEAGSVTVAVAATPTGETQTASLPLTVAVAWPSDAFSVPVTVTVSPTGQASSLAGGTILVGATSPVVGGFALGGAIVQLNVTDSNGNPVTSFQAPLDIHIGNVPPSQVPAYSHDGVTWTIIPSLTEPTLGDGQPDGYVANADGSIDIYTRHATFFGLLQDVKAPTAPILTAALAGHTLRLNWHGAKDNIRVNGYRLIVNGRSTILTSRTLQNVAARVGRYEVVALDAVGNIGKRSATVTVSAKARPSGLPAMIPGWAKPLLTWQHALRAERTGRPVAAPLTLPSWYPAWAGWQSQPLRLSA